MAAKKLTDEKLIEYRESLIREKNELMKVIGDIAEGQRKGSRDNSGDLSAYSIHMGDLGSDTEHTEKEAYLMEKHQQSLKKINEALQRVSQRSYGICEMCGELISEARLRIVPYAHLCINCQAKEEEKNNK